MRVADLRLVAPPGAEPPPVAQSRAPSRSDMADRGAARTAGALSSEPAAASPSAPGGQISGDAIFAAIERLAELHKKDILSDEEFVAKKRELLSRL